MNKKEHSIAQSRKKSRRNDKGNLRKWMCSGCKLRIWKTTTGCNGYCRDDTGKSCDGFKCPKCNLVHYWTGSVTGGNWDDVDVY